MSADVRDAKDPAPGDQERDERDEPQLLAGAGGAIEQGIGIDLCRREEHIEAADNALGRPARISDERQEDDGDDQQGNRDSRV